MKRRTILWIFLFALVIACSTGTDIKASTLASGTCGDKLIWTISDDYTLTISGSGKMDDYYDSSTYSSLSRPWETYLDKIKKVIVCKGVTSIGDSAFEECGKVTSVTIPTSVTAIYGSAFYFCESLTSISLPDSISYIGDNTFACCTSLTSIVIPDKVTSIYYGTFADCPKLKSITIPDSVIYINETAFNMGTSDTVTIYVNCGSTAQNYAKEHNIKFSVLDHKWSAWKVTKAATALSAGKQTRTCSACKTTATKTISKLKATIKLSKTKLTLKKKKSYTLKISNLAKGDSVKSVKASKTSVASVKKIKTNQYKISGKKKGTATITVILKSGKKATVKLTVK